MEFCKIVRRPIKLQNCVKLYGCPWTPVPRKGTTFSFYSAPTRVLYRSLNWEVNMNFDLDVEFASKLCLILNFTARSTEKYG